MDNLEIAFTQKHQFDAKLIEEPVAVCIDENVCSYITNYKELVISELLESKSFQLQEQIGDDAFQVKYLSLWQVVIITTQTGLILFEPMTEKLTVLHSFTSNISSTSWNPNQNFVLVVDIKNVIYGFTFEHNTVTREYHFGEVSSSHLESDVAPGGVYVGWGSHQTQFQGTSKVREEQVLEIAQPYSPPVISWRENGDQFVINYWSNNRRVLKVFNRYLKAEFQSDTCPNLLPHTSFKGQGNFIACAAEQHDKNKIVIFEKNCLVKSQFWLPENTGQIKMIEYHPDLPILAVYSKDSSRRILNIYMNFNAKWYLKQQLVYPVSRRLITFRWITTPNKTMCMLNVLTSQGFEKISFRVVINQCQEHNLVAVIDGKTVQFTDFSQQIVPPPMSSLSLSFEKPIANIEFDSSSNMYQFITSDDETYYYTYENGEFKVADGTGFPSITPKEQDIFADIICRLERTVDAVDYEFLLDSKQDLTINGIVMCNNVWSIYIHGNYLLFTHASSKLFCIRLSTENLLGSAWNLEKFYSREIELGSKIVSVTAKSRVLVELPRGNLEAVNCRVIGIEAVEQLLKENMWKDSIEAIKNQKLTLNLLIDLNPSRFCEHIRDFVDAAKQMSELESCVAAFSEEDCFQSMYKHCFEPNRVLFGYNKKEIFLKVLEEISRQDPIQNLNSIVILYTKHFALLSVLKILCSMYQSGKVTLCKGAVSQILLHRHVRDVINEAFKVYDVDFMEFIYTCCSEDPLTFGPVLQQLRSLDCIDLRFRMNVLAKDVKGATKYLVRSKNLTENYISDFIIKNATEHEAYTHISKGNPHFEVVSKLYAMRLARAGRYDEAGYLFSRAGLYKEALEEYKMALNWQQVVSLLKNTHIEEDIAKATIRSMAGELVKNNRIDEAVVLYEFHLNDWEEAVKVLTEEKMFQKAFCMASKYACVDKIDQIIRPAAEKYRASLTERLTELKDKYIKYTARLQKIRQKKYLSLEAELENVDGGSEIDDMNSEYGSIVSSRGSSVASGSSRGSTLSSRNRRKQEKKKIDLREGGVYEDIALIRQLYLMIIEIFEYGKDVREICLALTDCDSFNQSRVLHEKLSDLQEFVRKNISNIWTDTFLTAEASTKPEIFAVNRNIEDLDERFRTPPPAEKMTDTWKVALFIKHTD